MELDRIDVGILRALQEDARRSFRELARRMGVSVPTVSARVANLEHLGIVAGYHAAIDPERLRQTRLVVLLKCRPSKTDAIGQTLAKFPEVRWTIRTRGSRVVAEAVVARSTDVEAFHRRVKSIDGVLTVEKLVAAKRYKDAPRALISGPLAAIVACVQCGKMMEAEPIKIRLDGRNHYLCCHSCETLYRERYAKLKAAAQATGRPHHD
jgi:Lrp/AsnC family leucine-responsive transcriptional regulator